MCAILTPPGRDRQIGGARVQLQATFLENQRENTVNKFILLDDFS